MSFTNLLDKGNDLFNLTTLSNELIRLPELVFTIVDAGPTSTTFFPFKYL